MHPVATRLAILGPGLLGGSLAGAARMTGAAQEICVWARRRAAADLVAARGWADVASDLVAVVVEGADLIVLATPVGAMPALAQQIVANRDRLAPGVVITDVGSVKGCVAEKVAPLFKAAGLTFVGSHPMAGAEVAGFEAARADLFQDAACILTGPGDPPPRLREFWQAVGCRIFTMTPSEHDAAVARVSHVPHLAASAVALAMLRGTVDDGVLAGRGFRDTTRVASGDPALWTEILLENGAAIEKPLAELVARLSEALDFVRRADDGQLRQFLAEAKSLRDQALAAPDSPSHG